MVAGAGQDSDAMRVRYMQRHLAASGMMRGTPGMEMAAGCAIAGPLLLAGCPVLFDRRTQGPTCCHRCAMQREITRVLASANCAASWPPSIKISGSTMGTMPLA